MTVKIRGPVRLSNTNSRMTLRVSHRLTAMRGCLAAPLCLCLTGVATAGTTSCNLQELHSAGNAAVRSYVATLTVGDIGPGVRLCDGDTILRGWRFAGGVVGLAPSQHVYLFETLQGPRAVAWIDSRGHRLEVPPCRVGARCEEMDEAAFTVSGDVYTYRYIQPDNFVVLITYPPKQWNSAAVDPHTCPVSMSPDVEKKVLLVLDATTEVVRTDKAYEAVWDQLLNGKDDASIEARVALMDYPIDTAHAELLSCVVSTGGKRALHFLELYSRCDIAPSRSPVPRNHTDQLRSNTLDEWKRTRGKGSCDWE